MARRRALATAVAAVALLLGLALVESGAHGATTTGGVERRAGLAAPSPSGVTRLGAATDERISVAAGRVRDPSLAGLAGLALACACLLGWRRAELRKLSGPRRRDADSCRVRGPPDLACSLS